MGKRIISRARGKGGPRYKAPSHRYVAKPKYIQAKEPVSVEILDIIHDPARNTPLAKIKLGKEEKFIIAVEGLKVGDAINFGKDVKLGNILPLKLIPEGVPICGIESLPQSGPKFCKGSGVYGSIISKGERIIIKMPSGQFKEFHPNCLATIGIPAGGGKKDKPFVKAGQLFYKMKAKNKLWPRTSAVKMNPVDHPFGGSTKPGKPKTISRDAPPGRKVGSIAAKRTGKKKK